MSIQEKVARNIRRYRKAKGFTQKHMAKLMEVTPAAVCRWESGKGSMPLTTLDKISNILEVDVRYLVAPF